MLAIKTLPIFRLNSDFKISIVIFLIQERLKIILLDAKCFHMILYLTSHSHRLVYTCRS